MPITYRVSNHLNHVLHNTKSTKHKAHTVEFAYNNAFSLVSAEFHLLCAFELGYDVTSTCSDTFVCLCRIFCSFITTFASFLYSLKCKLGYVEPLPNLL